MTCSQIGWNPIFTFGGIKVSNKLKIVSQTWKVTASFWLRLRLRLRLRLNSLTSFHILVIMAQFSAHKQPFQWTHHGHILLENIVEFK